MTATSSKTAPSRTARVLVPATVFSLLILVWMLATLGEPAERIIPSPPETFRALVNDIGVLPRNVSATVYNAAVGFVAGNTAAILFALMFVQVPLTEKVLFRVTAVTACVPLVVITPILVILFQGDTAKQALAAIAVFFPTLSACFVGLRSGSATSEDVVRSMGGGSSRVLLKVRLWSMLPHLFTALQIAAPAALVGAILAEWLGSTHGLGVLLLQAQSSYEIPRTWSIAFVMAAVSGAAYLVLGIVGRRLTPWVAQEVSLHSGVKIQAPRPRGKGTAAEIGALALSVLVILALWWGTILLFSLDPYFAKTPLDVWSHLFSGPESAERRQVILEALGVTLTHTGVGYAVGLIAAFMLATVSSLSPVVERTISPLAVAIRALPLVALVPVLTLTFGRGLPGVTVIITLVTFFPAYVTIARAFASSPVLARDLVASMGGSKIKALISVQMPYAVPAFVSSARIVLPLALAGATLAEWMATGNGIGNLLIRDFATSQFGAVWSGAAVLIAVSLAAYGVLSAVETRLNRHYSL
ncbi:ABC transporter permease [Nesterenkonia flava]|uniref:ABC transporter permease subunit n=1 Tax=Nesterenkonia flava TaxID=469799 RepID=A0ABU1FXW7_9MICC|nr:ABC transporter permease subunit [Nesterenkonia flava]MDR5713107.1 ABC transporter permease subunit [Nesterenkonia flava]